MSKKWLAAGAVAAVMASPGVAAAQPAPDNWGQVVSSCNHTTNCYPGDTSRGGYVNGQARDNQGPGYGWEIQNLANPGNANPPPFNS